MKSRATSAFWKLYRQLPGEVRQQANKAYRLWFDEPRHPSLQFKKVHPSRPIYSVRVGRYWRACGVVEEDTIIWFWIGSHAAYDQLLSRL